MKVVILCGGKGTRIRDVSDEIPKPMIPIGEYPIVHHIMHIYSSHNYNEFVLCLGHKGWKIKEYFLNYRAQINDFMIDFGDKGKIEYFNENEVSRWRVFLAETGLESMTGSRIKQVQKYIGDESFMLTYGDGVGDVDITELVKFHKSHGKLITITAVSPPSRFGTLVVDGKTVRSFEEKTQTAGGLINGGFFVCEPEVFDYLSDDETCTFEQSPLHNLAKDGQMMAYFHKGFWMPMDTSREYLLLNDMWNRGMVPWWKRSKR
jgi:glucose-1-phosphate cytidylyltransferase